MVKKRIVYFDVIKILSSFLVIFNHSHWYIMNEGTLVNGIHHLLFCICKIAVPLFIMVSGALILGKKTNYKEIFTRRIFRVIVPLLFIFTLSSLIYHATFSEFIRILFTNDITFPHIPYWTWYLYLLISLYLMTPFLQKMIKNFDNKDYIVFIIIVVFGLSFIYESMSIFKLFLGENIMLNDSITLGIFPVAIGYYVMGYYLYKLKITRKIFKISSLLLILFIIFGTLLLRLGIMRGIGYDEVLRYNYFIVAVNASCTFIIVKYLTKKLIKKVNVKNIIGIIGDSGFGVYLFHLYLIEYLSKTRVFYIICSYSSLAAVLLVDITIFLLLTIVFYFLRKIPFIKKFI